MIKINLLHKITFRAILATNSTKNVAPVIKSACRNHRIKKAFSRNLLYRSILVSSWSTWNVWVCLTIESKKKGRHTQMSWTRMSYWCFTHLLTNINRLDMPISASKCGQFPVLDIDSRHNSLKIIQPNHSITLSFSLLWKYRKVAINL